MTSRLGIATVLLLSMVPAVFGPDAGSNQFLTTITSTSTTTSPLTTTLYSQSLLTATSTRLITATDMASLEAHPPSYCGTFAAFLILASGDGRVHISLESNRPIDLFLFHPPDYALWDMYRPCTFDNVYTATALIKRYHVTSFSFDWSDPQWTVFYLAILYTSPSSFGPADVTVIQQVQLPTNIVSYFSVARTVTLQTPKMIPLFTTTFTTFSFVLIAAVALALVGALIYYRRTKRI